MSLTTVFNIFLRQSVREQEIPFQVSKHVPNTTTLAAIETAEKQEDVFGPCGRSEEIRKALGD